MTDEETSWQNEAIQQNRLLFDALVRAEIAEKRLAKAVEALKFTYSTLTEINPSNYDHDQVCEQNSASVEAILSIAAVLAELEKTE